MPTMPTWTREVNSRAASPSRVKIATPLPYSCSDGSATASSQSFARTTQRTGHKNSSSHHREARAKNLFLVDPHVLRDVVEQAAAHVKPVLVALHFEAAAVHR